MIRNGKTRQCRTRAGDYTINKLYISPMKTRFTLLLLLAGSLSATAQVLTPEPTVVKIAVVQDPHPLVLVDSRQTTINDLIVAPEQIASVEVFKDQQAVRLFGSKAKAGAVIIKLKGDKPLARVQEVYNHFRVPQEQHKLKLAVNDQLVADKDLLLADLQLIEKVELKTQDVTAVNRFSFDEGAPYLNIVTVKQ